MNITRHGDTDFEGRLKTATSSSSLFDPVIQERAKNIVDAVAARGDEALIEFTERFDGARLAAEGIQVTKAELFNASLQADEELRAAILLSQKNVERFSRKSLRKPWTTKNAQGGVVGEKFDPFERVGIYIPGGTAPLVSTAIMTVTLARVAGCREIAVCTPCGPTGEVNPALLFALNSAGATEIYKLGGAQAVAALALGTSTIRKVQKIYGPGNAYVVAAKRLLFGHVAVDLLPGPSELLVLADDSAEPRFIAADMLAQAEHGSGHERVWLVTTSARLIKAVEKELAAQMPKLSRAAYIAKALEANAWLIQVKSLADGIALTNKLAPEHCEIMTAKPAEAAKQILTAGALFLGPLSPTVLGDYVAGPSHELPTGGAGASFAGLTVDQFQRRTSVVVYNAAALKKSVPALQKLAQVEGLDAHARSATIRLEAPGKKQKGKSKP